MAEVVGTIASVITLIGLLKGCIDACEMIRAAKDYRIEVERYDLKLALEQCRLKTWGRSMGLVQDEDAQHGRHLLEHFEFRPVIEEALKQIINLLTDSDRLGKRYGAQKMSTELVTLSSPDSWISTSTLKLTRAFKGLRMHNTIRNQASAVVRSSVWVIYDQKKYASLIEELRTLVDAVENVARDLITREQQQQLFISRINAISDVRTLNLITEVCEVDHPAFSDAASVRAGVISFTTTHKADLVDWIDNATNELDESQERITDTMEDWDLDDFRRQYLALLNIQALRSSNKSGMGDIPEHRGGDSESDDSNLDEGDDDNNIETSAKTIAKDTSSTRMFSEDDLRRGGPVQFKDAMAYVNKIKDRFSQRPHIYMQFLRILQNYQREARPIQDLYSRVIELFGPEGDLIEDFKHFLPESTKHVQRPKSQLNDHTEGLAANINAGLQTLVATALKDSKDTSISVSETPPLLNSESSQTLNDALQFLDLVKAECGEDPRVYNMFLDIMKDFKDQVLDYPRVLHRVQALFKGHEVLIKGFETFLPPAHTITNDDEKPTTKPSLPSEEVQLPHVSSYSATGNLAMAVNTMVPDTTPLSEIVMGLDMEDPETLRYYSELLVFKYGTGRDMLAFSPHLGPESRSHIADIAERFGLSHDEIVLVNNTVQLIVCRPHQGIGNSDDDDDRDNSNAGVDGDDSDDNATWYIIEERGNVTFNLQFSILAAPSRQSNDNLTV
ncbi:prion-inhibition and propagation-domain-containing protein [Astrocystis sublimbata]|nr:prion-inhibition and propagation-domain-containing protein [Astrocystis sublimbata]